MTVIINELEIVVEPPEEQAPDGAPAAATPSPGPTAMDLTELLERRARLSRRLLAH